MHIGLVAPPWQPVPPPAYGAIEAVVHDLAVELPAAGHAVTVATTGDSTVPVGRVCVYDRARVDAPGLSSVEALHAVAAYDALAQADIVHDHTLVGPLLGARLGRPVVTTCHWSMTGDAGRLYDRIAQEVPTIAVSAAQRRSAPATPFVRVIHHGVDPTAFPLGDGEGSYLLVLGRMDPVKGIHVAVDVARRAGVPLLVAGPARSDAERRYFATQIEPRLGPGVTYVGEVGGERKLSLLRNARALLMPVQWEEPFGMVVVEALATGTPVLAFDRGAMAEIVEDGRTGLICADADAMVEAVARGDALDRGVCRAAVEDRFSSRRMAAEHAALYADVIRNGPPSLSPSRVS